MGVVHLDCFYRNGELKHHVLVIKYEEGARRIALFFLFTQAYRFVLVCTKVGKTAERTARDELQSTLLCMWRRTTAGFVSDETEQDEIEETGVVWSYLRTLHSRQCC